MIIALYVYQPNLVGETFDFNQLAFRLLSETQMWNDFTGSATGKYPGLTLCCKVHEKIREWNPQYDFARYMANELGYAHLCLPTEKSGSEKPDRLIYDCLSFQGIFGVEQVNLVAIPDKHLLYSLEILISSLGRIEFPLDLIYSLSIGMTTGRRQPSIILIQIQADHSANLIQFPYPERLHQVRDLFDLSGYKSPVSIDGDDVPVPAYVQQLAYEWLVTGDNTFVERMTILRELCTVK